MITDQVIQSLYAIILMEIGLLLLVLLLMVIDLKKSIDAIHKLTNKAVHLGNNAVDNAADVATDITTELKTNLTTISGITSVIGNISAIVSSWKGSPKSQDLDETDDLGEALSKVVPKKKRRII
jgi:hypothetical protein